MSIDIDISCEHCGDDLEIVREQTYFGIYEVTVNPHTCDADHANAPHCNECGKKYGSGHDDLCLENTPSG